jgi:hypothetical protein
MKLPSQISVVRRLFGTLFDRRGIITLLFTTLDDAIAMPSFLLGITAGYRDPCHLKLKRISPWILLYDSLLFSCIRRRKKEVRGSLQETTIQIPPEVSEVSSRHLLSQFHPDRIQWKPIFFVRVSCKQKDRIN